MNLSAALTIAQSALATSSQQSALVSRNIANANNPNYARESAIITTGLGGGSKVGSVQRATNSALTTNLLIAQSQAGMQDAVSQGYTQLSNTLGLDSLTSSSSSASDQSASTMLAALTNALQQYASAPDSTATGAAAVNAAVSLARNLNQASATVQSLRAQMDTGIAASVKTINTLLSQFQGVNAQVVAGTAVGADVSDALDQRAGILSDLSTQMGITTTSTPDGGLQIYSDGGVTLFDNTARTLSFDPISTYAAASIGNAVTVDGVPITGPSAVMPSKSGTLAGLSQIRDVVAPSYQNQLDQIADGLISTFAETQGSGASAVVAPGLFTAPGATGTPLINVTGLAGLITINPSIDPSAGGDLTRLRDGTISGGTSANSSGSAAYADNLNSILARVNQVRNFDSRSGGAATGTLANYASSSVSWLEAGNKDASTQATYTSSVVNSNKSALSNAVGVNLDDEMSRMLDIEHAYQASAHLMNTVDSMYSSLMAAMN